MPTRNHWKQALPGHATFRRLRRIVLSSRPEFHDPPCVPQTLSWCNKQAPRGKAATLTPLPDSAFHISPFTAKDGQACFGGDFLRRLADVVKLQGLAAATGKIRWCAVGNEAVE